MEKYLKLITNSMLLIILIGIVALPAVSTGVMRVQKNGRVLSSQDVRITTPTVKTQPVKLNITESYVIKEKPYTKIITSEDMVTQPDTAVESTQSTTIQNTEEPAQVTGIENTEVSE